MGSARSAPPGARSEGREPLGTSAALPRVGELLLGKYEILRPIGGGGSSTVFEARHLRLGRKVAIKCLLLGPDSLPAALGRFEREAHLLSQLDLPHIVRIFDVDTSEAGVPFLVLELLDGDNLAERLRQNGPFAVDMAVDCILQACAALTEVHRAGVVHRDIKPSNLIALRNADGVFVKLVDFGLAKLPPSTATTGLTASSDTVGTPLYMAPEQLQKGGEVDARTDVWALGATLYALLAGTPPFVGNLTEVAMRIMLHPPKPLARFRNDVPAALEAAVMRAMEKDPARRFETVDSFADAIRTISRRRILVPTPPKRARSLFPALGLAALAVGMVLALVFGLGRGGTASTPAPSAQAPRVEDTSPAPATASGEKAVAVEPRPSASDGERHAIVSSSARSADAKSASLDGRPSAPPPAASASAVPSSSSTTPRPRPSAPNPLLL